MNYGSISPSHPPGTTILVVDDEALVRLMVADELREHDYSILEAGSGDEAAKILRQGAQVDLVFTDVRMPGAIDGIALAKLINSEFPNIRVIIASGHVSGLPLGAADGFFSKPYDLASVVRKIETLLATQGRATLRSHPQFADKHSFETATE